MLSIAISQFVSLTQIKISLARILYNVIRIFIKSDRMMITRNGIKYSVDISEGIDFSLFLLGNFQKHVLSGANLNSNEVKVIVDVGANIGCMSLEFANQFPNAIIHSFEPTNYAFNKFENNLSLNPKLRERIVVNKMIVSSSETEPKELSLYSSWKLSKKSEDRHKVHGGIAQSTSMVDVVSLDSYTKKNHIDKIDLVKIDTDGFEFEVLKGSEFVLKNLRPEVIFEIGLYIMEEKNITFNDYVKFFSGLHYDIYDISGKKIVTLENYKKIIPKFGTTDLLAIPKKK